MPIEKISPIHSLRDSKKDNQPEKDTKEEHPKGGFQAILDEKMEGNNPNIKAEESIEGTLKNETVNELPSNIKPDFKKGSFAKTIEDILKEDKK